MNKAIYIELFLRRASEAESNGYLAGWLYNCAVANACLLIGEDREAAKELLHELKLKLIKSGCRSHYVVNSKL